jgi:hypothetical protein
VPEPAVTLSTGLPPLPVVVASALLLFLPGYALGVLLLPRPGYRGIERLLAAPALTLAALALLTLWATMLHLPLGPPAAGAVLLASVLALAWAARGSVSTLARLAGSARATVWKPTAPMWSALTASGLVVAYLALFLLAAGLRLWSTSGVLPTLGADTYHHTLIARLIVERGGLPDSYMPYAPIDSFAYHFGFHSLVAWLHWWTGADVGPLVGLAGHLVNAAVALAVAFFVLRVLGDGLVAALSAWLVALLCVFPAYLTNWGRFTQTAGLVLLPVGAALCIDALRPEHGRRPALLPGLAAALAASGLFLAHYRMAAMLAVLLAVWWMYWAARPFGPAHGSLRRTLERLGRGAWRLGLMALAAGGLALPWLVRLPGSLALGLGEQPGDYGADYYGLERLGTAATQPTNLPLLLLAALGLGLAWLLHKQSGAAGREGNDDRGHAASRYGTEAVLALGAWALAQVALANPRWWPVPMPLAGRVDLVTTIAALCFPVAVAAGLALAVSWRVAIVQWGRRGVAAGLAIAVGATALGAWQLQALVTPDNVLVTPADLVAADWLRAQTPPDARIAVSAVIVPWAPDYVVGVDGGYWLPLLAGRATMVLPMLYPGERGADRAAVTRMVAIAQALRTAPAAPETAALLWQLGVSYVYHSGRSPIPAVDGLASNPALTLMYAADSVRIWAVAPP